MKYTGAELILTLLERQGVKTITGIPGGSNLPLYDALPGFSFRHILARHEQGAGFMAQGMARVTRQAAVCFATSGPGVTNLLTAIADAKMDSVPLVAITGQVPLSLLGTDAFQEIDTFGLTIPITKHNYLVRSVEELAEVIPDAFRIALSGRPGPVVVDVPKDVQMATIELEELPEPGQPLENPVPGAKARESFFRMLSESERPLLLVGGGATDSDHEAVEEFARRCSLPSISTLRGLGVIPADSPLQAGMVGMHGSNIAARLTEQCDLFIVAGARFDDRVTGDPSRFVSQAKVIHVDLDAVEIHKIKEAHLGIHGHAGSFFRSLLEDPALEEAIRSSLTPARQEWQTRAKEWIREEREESIPSPEESHEFHPELFLRKFAAHMRGEDLVATDVGQHQMWVAQHIPFRRPNHLLTSAGLGTMGFGLPAAMGAALARPEGRVFLFTGDGSIMMNLQELATLAEWDLNVKIVLLNNRALGMVRQQQELFFEGRHSQSLYERSPRFEMMAESFGIPSLTLHPAKDSREQLRELLEKRGPALIHVPVHREALVFPSVPPGKPNGMGILRSLYEGRGAASGVKM